MSDTNGSQAADKALDDARAAGDAIRQVGQQAKQAGSDAVGQTMGVAHDAKARAGSLAGAIGEKTSSVAEAQKGDLANKLEDVAKVVHRSGEQAKVHQDWMAHLVERGAAELNSLATTLRSNDLHSVLGNRGGLARWQPALFVGLVMEADFTPTRVGRLAASAPAHAAPPTPPHAPSAAPRGMPSSVPPTVPATVLGSLRVPPGPIA